MVSNTLDSITIQVPTELITYDENYYTLSNVMDGEVKSKVFSKDKFYGFNDCRIGIGTNTAYSISGKILGNDYYDGISIDNIDSVLDNLREYSHTDFNTDDFLRNSVIRKVDVCKNLKVGRSISDVIEKFSLLNIDSGKYKVDRFKNESIVWTRRVKSYKERFTMYDKKKELLSKGKHFINCFNSGKILSDFDNVIRLETNLTSFKTIRTYFCSNNSLSGILNSNTDVINSIYGRITDDSHKLFELLKYKMIYRTWSDYVRWVGLNTIFSNYDDWKTLRTFVLSFYKDSSNPGRQLAQVKKDYFQWREDNLNSNDIENRDQLIIEFEELLGL